MTENSIFFTVIGANGLEADEGFETFVAVSVGNQIIFRTRSKMGESPQWNETHPIHISGPQSVSVAVHSESPTSTGATLIGEIKDITIDSGPPELRLPIYPLNGSRPIIITVAIRRWEDMHISERLNDHKGLLCLSDFVITPISDRHPDIPYNAHLSVVIIGNGNILYETTPIAKESSESHWHCGGKVIISSGMVYKLEVIYEDTTRQILGSVQLDLERVNHVMQTMVQYTQDDRRLQIQFSAQVFGHDTSASTTNIGLFLDAPDLNENSLALPELNQSSSTSLAGYNPGENPSLHTIRAMANGEITEPVELNVLGDEWLKQFELEGDELCLALAMVAFSGAIQLLPDDHQDWAMYLWKFGMTLLYQFQRLETLPNMNGAIMVFTSSALRFPDGHPTKTLCLHKLGNMLHRRFKMLGNISDLEKAISALKDALELTPTDHPERIDSLTNLGISYLTHFKLCSEISDLEMAISVLENAVLLTPDGHPSKAAQLSNLGISLHLHFEQCGDISDLEKAIPVLKNAIELTPNSHPDLEMCLIALGMSLQCRFENLGEISDLEMEISIWERVVDHIPNDHPSKAMNLNHLGNSLKCHFQCLGEVAALEKAISVLENAVKLAPTQLAKAMCLTNLGNSLKCHFDRFGGIPELEKAISVLENAVKLNPIDDLDKAAQLCNLGNLLQCCFARLGDISDLERAILVLQNAIELTPNDHIGKGICLNNLGISLLAQFVSLGDISDLEMSISILKNGVDLAPNGHPSKVVCLSNLGNSFHYRFERLGEISDLEQAISARENALNLTPTSDPDRASHLMNLGSSFECKFERFGEISDLEKSISAKESALELTPTGHPKRAMYLSSLGSSFLFCFQRFGELPYLEKAISALEKGLDLTPPDHPNRAVYLNNLGNCFDRRFERLGEMSDLERAISIKENVVDLTPTGHPGKVASFYNLGLSLQDRFNWLGEISDLERAISAFNNAVDLSPTGHPQKAMYLCALGAAFQSCFERLGEISDLEKAISLLESAVELIPADHPGKAKLLLNLGSSYNCQFKNLGEISALEKAIAVLQKVIDLTPADDPGKGTYLGTLGISFQYKFESVGETSALENSISALQNAVDLTPTGHPGKAISLTHLGASYLHQFTMFGENFHLNQAIDCFSQSSQLSTSPPIDRFIAANIWAICAGMAGISPLNAHNNVLQLLPRVAWIGLPILDRYNHLSDFSHVVHEAATAAITSQQYELALEWLEQGRSIVWNQLLHLQSPVDELLVKEPALRIKLLAVSQALGKASARDIENSISAEKITQNHHLLALEWDRLVKEVQNTPGFEGFFQPMKTSQLMPAANLGPVVAISLHTTGCHAIVLKSTPFQAANRPLNGFSEKDPSNSSPQALQGNIVHIPLPNFSYGKAQDMHLALRRLQKSRFSREVVFEHDSQAPQLTFEEILSDLWILVVLPILDGLALSVPNNGELPHIWWCPTGPLAFLPIHAAGIYNMEELGHKLSDFAVSSYTPTITALLNSQHNSPSATFKILAIAQASNPGQSPLPHTDTELENLRNRAGQICVESLKGAQATVEHVVQAMSESTWVHLACHGTQNPSDPTKSAFILADGNLELSKITRMSLPQAEFAFLSACQTAAGDATLQEEAVHLAAGMLMAGYRSVIATMWSIRDQDGPLVADDVYAELLRNGQPDHTRAAYALHNAIQNLRRSGAPFFSWVPFIHMGR